MSYIDFFWTQKQHISRPYCIIMVTYTLLKSLFLRGSGPITSNMIPYPDIRAIKWYIFVFMPWFFKPNITQFSDPSQTIWPRVYQKCHITLPIFVWYKLILIWFIKVIAQFQINSQILLIHFLSNFLSLIVRG